MSEKLYVLIDEYDTFATALLSGNEIDLYSKVTDKMGFVRAFYRTLKAGTWVFVGFKRVEWHEMSIER